MAFNFSKKYNRDRLFDIDVTGLEYHSLKEIFENEDVIYTLEAIYINRNSQFAAETPCVVASNDHFRGYVNLPEHKITVCKDILADDAAIAAINAGKVGFTIYRYHSSTYNKDCYSIRWIDL